MLQIQNNDNYMVPRKSTRIDIGVQVSFRLSDDGVNFSKPMDCIGFLNGENDVKEIVEFFYEDYKEMGYTEVELVSIYIEVESLNELKKVKN